MRIAIDAMGGDNAPGEIIKGACEATKLLDKDDELILIGRADVINAQLSKIDVNSDQLRVVHAPDVIEMDDPPIESLRKKRKSSIALMARMAAHKQLDAVISAGNTGACVAGFQIRMRNLEGVNRPGIAAVLPTVRGPVTICDVGANVACKPINLYQNAVMASIYSTQMLGIKNPRVGLMSIGSEEAKGNDLVRSTLELIKSDERLNFIGNLEGHDLFHGTCDVAICEGFIGNVTLKIAEGLVKMLFTAIKHELVDLNLEKAKEFEPIMAQIYKKYDYHEHGGAVLLGINGTAVICHGSSKSRTIKNTVAAIKKYNSNRINEKIVEFLSESSMRAASE